MVCKSTRTKDKERDNEEFELFYVEHVTPAVDFVSPCASRQAPRLVYWTDEMIKKRISMLEKLQYQSNKKVGFIVEDNDLSVEPNMDARLSNVEKEVKDLRGDLNNLVVGVSQSIESAKEEILIAIAKVANGSWAIEKEKHSHDIDCQLKNEDILDDKWSPPSYAFQDRKFPMDKQLKQENEGLPKTPLCDQFTSSVSPFAPFFSEHELLPPKLPKVILKRSIPEDDGAESSTILPYHMKLRSKQLDMLPKYGQKEATMKNEQVVVFLEQHSKKISELLSMPTLMKGFDLLPLSVEDKLIRDYLFHRIALQFTLKQKDCIPNAKYPTWYLPTYFSQHIFHHKIHKPNMLMSYFGTERYKGKIESCERVYIPINDAGEHWCMCVVEVLHDLLGIQYKNAYTHKITEFPIRTLEWLPQQSNGYDYRMHTIKYFELVQFIDFEACLLQFDS
ncbi:hypothetical protein LOK49_LG06G00890 [Camellia lanceoleosa]|uniref:Uncharacterized protein n=1 Tax=Camellia lanceoleosa TaxID=1840588 RepID=A0ACC0HIS8_9ERIC|nr:hypothetical protein LOK49_LG06G00890 [Camellia lanceoleosa]